MYFCGHSEFLNLFRLGYLSVRKIKTGEYLEMVILTLKILEQTKYKIEKANHQNISTATIFDIEKKVIK